MKYSKNPFSVTIWKDLPVGIRSKRWKNPRRKNWVPRESTTPKTASNCRHDAGHGATIPPGHKAIRDGTTPPLYVWANSDWSGGGPCHNEIRHIGRNWSSLAMRTNAQLPCKSSVQWEYVALMTSLIFTDFAFTCMPRIVWRDSFVNSQVSFLLPGFSLSGAFFSPELLVFDGVVVLKSVFVLVHHNGCRRDWRSLTDPRNQGLFKAIFFSQWVFLVEFPCCMSYF